MFIVKDILDKTHYSQQTPHIELLIITGYRFKTNIEIKTNYEMIIG